MKYQAQNAAAILQNFNAAIEANETALNSQGSASRENEKVLDSVEGKVKALESAWQNLSRTFIDSDFVKIILEIGTAFTKAASSGVVQFLVKMAEIFAVMKGGIFVFKAAASGVSNLMTLFKQSWTVMKGYKESLSNTGAAFKLLTNKAKVYSLQQKINNAVDGKSTMTLKQMKVEMGALGIATEGVTTKREAQIVVNQALAASQLALNVAMGIASLAITAAITGISTYIAKQKEAQEEAVSTAQEITEQNKSIDDQVSAIENYQKTLKDETSSTEDIKTAKEGLKEIQDQLIETYGAEAKNIDLVNESYNSQIKKINQLKKEKAQEWLADKQKAIKKAKKKASSNTDEVISEKSGTFEKFAQEKGMKSTSVKKAFGYTDVGVSGEAEKLMDFYKEYSKYLQENKATLLANGMAQEEYDDLLSQTSDIINNLNDDYGQYIKTRQAAAQKELEATDGYYDQEEKMKKLGEQGKLTKEELEKMPKALKEAYANSGQTLDDLQKKYQDTGKATDNMVEAIGKSKNLKKASKEMQNLAKKGKLTSKAMKNLAKRFPELKEVMEDWDVTADDVSNRLNKIISKDNTQEDVIKDYTNQLLSLEDQYSTLKDIQDEYNETGKMSAEMMQSLIDNNLLQYVTATADGFIFNTEAVKANAASLKDQAGASLLAAMNQDLENLALGKTDKLSQLAKNALNNAGTSAETNGTKAKNASGGWFKLATGIKAAKTAAEGGKLGGDADDVKAVIKEYEDTYNKLNNLDWSFSGSGSGGSGGSGGSSGGSGRSGRSSGGSGGSSKSSSDTKKWWEKQLDSLKEKYDMNKLTLDAYIKGLGKLLKKTKKGSKAWHEVNEEMQKMKLEKIEDAYDRGTISVQKYISELKKLQKAYKKNTKSWLELQEKIRKGQEDLLKDTEDRYSRALDAANNLIDKEIDKLDKLRDSIEERYDKEIEAKEKANEETEKAIELEELQQRLENARKEKNKRVYVEGQGWQWQADAEAIKEAQDELDDFLKEKEISDLEEKRDKELEAIDNQIKKWEEYQDAWSDISSKYEDAQDQMVLAQLMGANFEKSILNQRISALQEFKNKYISIQKQLSDFENETVKALGKGKSLTYTVQKGDTLTSIAKKYNTTVAKLKSANKGLTAKTLKEGKQIKIGYKDGGIVDFTGYAKMHGTPSRPEYVLNHNMMKNLMTTLRYGTPTLNKGLGTTNNTKSYNFYGNIELPRVSNATQFISDLKSLVNTSKHN